jgi:predicted RecB family nuclease
MYVDRFGDRDDVAARVRRNLVDLLPITQQALALPLPSYGLKVVDRYVGFSRAREGCTLRQAQAR